MNDKKKEAKDKSIYIDIKLHSRFKSYCAENGKPMKRIIELLIKDFLIKKGIKLPE